MYLLIILPWERALAGTGATPGQDRTARKRKEKEAKEREAKERARGPKGFPARHP